MNVTRAGVVALLAVAVSGCSSAPAATDPVSTQALAPPPSATTASGTPDSAAATLTSTPTPTPTPSAPTTTVTTPAAEVATAAAPTVAAGAHERPSRGGVLHEPSGDGALTGRTIVVDPGHNGTYVADINTRQVDAGGGARKACNTSGTANASMAEHALNWTVANELVTELRRRGATVWTTRPDDEGVGPCVDERAAIGNRAGADLVVSIHADGNESASARGFHVITSTAMAGGPEAQAQSGDLARSVVAELERTGMPRSTYTGGGEGIVPRSDIAGLNLSLPPAVMVEMGNMHHAQDAALFASPEFRSRVAQALADAVTGQAGR